LKGKTAPYAHEVVIEKIHHEDDVNKLREEDEDTHHLGPAAREGGREGGRELGQGRENGGGLDQRFYAHDQPKARQEREGGREGVRAYLWSTSSW